MFCVFFYLGALDPASILEQIELQVYKVKEEAFSRKEILEKVEKWLSAREEEEWLEQYNMVALVVMYTCHTCHLASRVMIMIDFLG